MSLSGRGLIPWMISRYEIEHLARLDVIRITGLWQITAGRIHPLSGMDL